MLVAMVTMEARSVRFAGTTSVVPACASLPNCFTYSSPMRSCMASMPPRSESAMPTWRSPSAVAVATARIACAWPSASLICCCLLASDCLITRCLSPSAALILASRSPSEVSTTARFSRSARICFSIADSTSFGGVMFLIS